jgi:hypothetical protein
VSDRGDAAQQIKKRTWEAVRPSRVRQLFREVDPVSRFRKQHEEGNRIHHAASQPGEFSNAIPPRRSRDHGTLGAGQIGAGTGRGLAYTYGRDNGGAVSDSRKWTKPGDRGGIAVGIAGRDPLQSNEKDGHRERALRKGLIW